MTPFVDTNVIVYAFLSDHPNSARARSLLHEGVVISAQVLNEFSNIARRKLGMSWPAIGEAARLIVSRATHVIPLTASTHAMALKIASHDEFAFYDALIVAAAIEAGCSTLLSEDMSHGRHIGGLTIANPFR